MLGKKKAPIKRLKKIANQVLAFYAKGIGNEKNINKKIEKFRIPRTESPCYNSKESDKITNNAAFCETWHTLECEDGVLIIKLQKSKKNTDYVQYDEYIFK